MLPGPEELPGWVKDGEPQHFEGEDLFIYIDGGAEIYFEFGFRQVVVQDYRTATGSRLSLEIFQMDSPESAYGIYAFKTSRRGEPVALGDDCQLADYYLNLRKGPFLATITGLDATDAVRNALLSLARIIEPRIGPAAVRPGLVSRLPDDGLETQSIKYFKGALSLYNSYPFFQRDVFSFTAGVKGDYAPGYALYIFEYPAEPAARLGFDRARRNFLENGKYGDSAERKGFFQVKDQQENRIFITVRKRYVLVLVGNVDETSASKILHHLEGKLSDT